jgi:hypothetical protein
VLAVATFAAVRSANRAARTAERSLLVGLRPLLLPSRLEDPAQKVMWVDQHYAYVPGGRAVVEEVDGVIYLAGSVRNAGQGVAVLHGWHPYRGWVPGADSHAPVEEFRRLTRDLYIAPGDIGFWQGAVRDDDDRFREQLHAVAEAHERLTVDVLYGDYEGGQRAIARFVGTPVQDGYLLSVSRHWSLDRPDPR